MPGAIPQFQLDSLPILKSSDVDGIPGVTTITGKTVTKFWDQLALGINGVVGNQADPDPTAPPGSAIILSNAIDARGCKRFLLILVCRATGAFLSNFSWNVFTPQIGIGAGGAPIEPRTGAAGMTACGAQVAICDVNNAALLAGPFPIEVSGFAAWTHSQDSVYTRTGSLGICRIWLNSPAGSNDQLWYGSLWGSS